MLELFTKEIPFHYISQNGSVALTVMRGDLPQRPLDKEVIARGLDDEMWALMEECWAMDPTARPTTTAVLARLQKAPKDQLVKVKKNESDDEEGSDHTSRKPAKRVKVKCEIED